MTDIDFNHVLAFATALLQVAALWLRRPRRRSPRL